MTATQTTDNENNLQECLFAEPILPQQKDDSPLKSIKLEENDDVAPSNDNQRQQQSTISDFRYQEPIWALVPAEEKEGYFLEVIKEGTVIDTIRLHGSARQKSFWSIGRFEPCDIKLEHPSVSRFHAILQYGECVKGRPGWFLFDMNSTHGVKLNKRPVKKRSYVPLHNGFVFQIAGSSRIFTVCGGCQNEEKDERKGEIAPKMGKTDNTKDGENEGEEEDQHRYFEKDPMGWLQKYFDREGIPMHFQFTKSSSAEEGAGNLLAEFEDGQKKKKGRRHSEESNWTCSIELVSDVSLTCGNVVAVSAPSKRLAQLQCALVACERLNDACLLRISSLWNKRKNYAENDFYDSDEDTFLDRTGQIEEQREKRKQRFGAESFGTSVGHAKNYDELVKELSEVEAKLEVVRQEMQRLLQKNENREEQQGEEQQPKQLSFSMRMALSQLKGKEKKLLSERNKLQKLTEIAKPSLLLATLSLKKQSEREMKEEDGSEVGGTNKKEETTLGGEQSDKEDERGRTETNDVKQETVEIRESGEAMEKQTDNRHGVQAVSEPPARHTNGPSENDNGEAEGTNKIRNTIMPTLPPTEERFYSPALPPKHNETIETITPKFGMLTKEEMVRMKMLQRQMERKPELAAAAKKARIEQEMKAEEEHQQQQTVDVREKYATWLPPENQSGDGSTHLNQKFAGKY